MIKAEILLGKLDLLKPESAITWIIYEGESILEAIEIENHIKSLMKTGTLFLVPGYSNKGIDILSSETEYDDYTRRHKITIDGLVKEIKK